MLEVILTIYAMYDMHFSKQGIMVQRKSEMGSEDQQGNKNRHIIHD